MQKITISYYITSTVLIHIKGNNNCSELNPKNSSCPLTENKISLNKDK